MGGVSEKETLLWQLDLAWSLLQRLMKDMSDEQSLREPAPGSWSVRPDAAGNWSADWADEEPSPPPPTSIGWLLWHIGWWWSDVAERAFGNGSVSREEAPRPGSVDQARRSLLACQERWRGGLILDNGSATLRRGPPSSVTITS